MNTFGALKQIRKLRFIIRDQDGEKKIEKHDVPADYYKNEK